MLSDTYIPRRLDDQWKIGLWDVDVATPVLVMAVVGWLAGSRLGFFICVVLGIAVARWFTRIKADKHPAFARHWIYWHLPSTPLSAMRATPPSHLRRMVG